MHSNNSSEKSKSNSHSPIPTKQFSGVLVHPELFDLVSSGIISGDDAWLALIIDSYILWKDKGCLASIEKLSEEIGKKSRQVRRQIKILCGYREINGKWVFSGPRLIRIIGWLKLPDGSLIHELETKWSRITPENEWDNGDVSYSINKEQTTHN